MKLKVYKYDYDGDGINIPVLILLSEPFIEKAGTLDWNVNYNRITRIVNYHYFISICNGNFIDFSEDYMYFDEGLPVDL